MGSEEHTCHYNRHKRTFCGKLVKTVQLPGSLSKLKSLLVTTCPSEHDRLSTVRSVAFVTFWLFVFNTFPYSLRCCILVFWTFRIVLCCVVSQHVVACNKWIFLHENPLESSKRYCSNSRISYGFTVACCIDSHVIQRGLWPPALLGTKNTQKTLGTIFNGRGKTQKNNNGGG